MEILKYHKSNFIEDGDKRHNRRDGFMSSRRLYSYFRKSQIFGNIFFGAFFFVLCY